MQTPTYRAGFLPGVTHELDRSVMSPSMRDACCKAIEKLRGSKASVELLPYLRDAEAFVEAGMLQVAGRSGQECGPIEASMLVQGALNHAYSLFYWGKASEDPSNARIVLMASKLGDAAKAMLSKALEMAVSIARGAPRSMADPLAGFMDAVPSADSE